MLILVSVAYAIKNQLRTSRIEWEYAMSAIDFKLRQSQLH